MCITSHWETRSKVSAISFRSVGTPGTTVLLYNKVTYPNEFTRTASTWPLSLNLCNNMYVCNHMLISNIDSTKLMLFDSFCISVHQENLERLSHF